MPNLVLFLLISWLWNDNSAYAFVKKGSSLPLRKESAQLNFKCKIYTIQDGSLNSLATEMTKFPYRSNLALTAQETTGG